MNTKLRDQVLAAFDLTPDQEDAATERERDVAVTAGAGSGKTSTLVARYASLLADGVDLRRIIAITFTEKAAREMRSRVRKTLNDLAETSPQEERQFWVELTSKMDAARISTIHSLCNEILKAHPAEAVVDPRFEVLDEGLSGALRVQTVDDILATLVGMEEFEPIFRSFDVRYLTELFSFMLNKRLEVNEVIAEEIDTNQAVCQQMLSLMKIPAILNPVQALLEMGSGDLLHDAGDALASQVREMLTLWKRAEKAFMDGNAITGAGLLYQARNEKMGLRIGNRGSSAKELLKSLQVAYDEFINPICGGKDSKVNPPGADTEADFLVLSGLIQRAFSVLVTSYKEGLLQLGALDFDDLEYGAAQLLRMPQIREKWQAQVDALLVDEFQDTNQRQRDIVEALAGEPGKLFVVGDAKQSIYRFRRADVAVFRDIRQSIRSKGGLPVDLNLTFRAHAPLVSGMNDILSEVMGETEDPSRPYYEPFAPLVADRQKPREGVSDPHIEFVLGGGDNAETARPVAARALAARLIELKKQGHITSWDDVTLLFRAATNFHHYETAFEDVNIPFVTVAGQGFYDRAEIRDVLNILRALADPTDDLAMAGLLRSPAFGLTDAALYQLRWKGETASHYWAALHDDLSVLSAEDQQRAIRVVEILEDLVPQVDRVPVAELLKKLVDATDYRAIMAIQDLAGGGGRLWRNLDKLIEDAQASGKINVRDFLEYLTVINDAGAREGEAPAEALGSVRLMTIHRSKGLQFPIVVLADAGHSRTGKSSPAYVNPDLGLSFKMDPESLVYRLSKLLDKKQDETEEQRILYVALTRAREKLIISGHIKPSARTGWSASGWLNDLCLAANVDIVEAVDHAGVEVINRTANGHDVRVWAIPADREVSAEEVVVDRKLNDETELPPIYAPLVDVTLEVTSEDEVGNNRDWRVTGGTKWIPPEVVGKMVHKAIELWCLPGDPRLQSLLETAALNAGLAARSQVKAAVEESVELLNRFSSHPLRSEIESAGEVYHEVPYSRMAGGRAETGHIDLLFRDDVGWQIVDFKTDAIYSDAHRAELVAQYAGQMRRYADAIEALLGQKARVRICFLDDMGKVGVVEG